MSGGDQDFGWRLTWKGYKIIFDPYAIVYHKHRTTLYRYLKQNFKYGYGYAGLFKKHKDTLGMKYQVGFDGGGYKRMVFDLILRIPWRIITVPRRNEDKTLYLTEPICNFIEVFGSKLGLIYGSIKHRVLCL